MAGLSTNNRAWALVRALRTTDSKLCFNRVERLTFHVPEFPGGKGVTAKERITSFLLRMRQIKDDALQTAVGATLALIGCVNPGKGRGTLI